MTEKRSIKISNTQQIDEKVIAITFNIDWFLDDLSPFVECVLASCDNASIVEKITGADIYCLRIIQNDHVFLLNFEEYSQSCWFECATDNDIDELALINLQLKVV